MNNLQRSKDAKDNQRAMPYGGYHRREVPKEDEEITHSGPGTPLGEYMRRFWQPVAMSSQLTDVPLKIRIMSEDLVAFRDKRGRIGVLARHCSHRGASLEFGIIQECGIRCCYHGFHYDVDGTLIDVLSEPDRGARLRRTVAQGAYPAFERDGLVFAYLGPPDKKPPFPDWDAFEKYDDTRLLPFTNVFPCNWLQVVDNIADQVHTALLHQPARLYNGNPPPHLDVAPFTLTSVGPVPVLDYVDLRDKSAMAFVAGRRMSDELVWWRLNELIVPNMTQHAYLFEDGGERRLFHRVHMSRWYVPVDDTNSIIFGWRMFGKTIDPMQKGRENRIGWDDMDFLEGQVGNRPYEEQQRLPGDWEVIVSQRAIAVHALENPISGDVGVYMFRRLLRDAVRGKSAGANPEAMHARAIAGQPTHTYTQNTVLKVQRQPTDEEDRRVIREIGRKITDITAEADSFAGETRNAFVRDRLAALEHTYMA
jgi:phenylpropionate dioxygenase-like ring-hydroxylating dioxygenase large terminal subunit